MANKATRNAVNKAKAAAATIASKYIAPNSGAPLLALPAPTPAPTQTYTPAIAGLLASMAQPKTPWVARPAMPAPAPAAQPTTRARRGSGAAANRWAKGNVTGLPPIGQYQLTDLPPQTVIYVLVKNNPKGGTSQQVFNACYMRAGALVQQTTVAVALAGYLAHGYSQKLFYQHMAWDINHAYIAVQGINNVV